MTRQHGAMEFSTPPTDLDAVRHYRLGRLRDKMRAADVAGMLLFDPIQRRSPRSWLMQRTESFGKPFGTLKESIVALRNRFKLSPVAIHRWRLPGLRLIFFSREDPSR